MIYFSNVRKLFVSLSTVCSDGWFGIDCNQRCSTHCRHKSSCNHFTGQCDEGCDAGWVRPNCNTGKKCALLFYWNCILTCSSISKLFPPYRLIIFNLIYCYLYIATMLQILRTAIIKQSIHLPAAGKFEGCRCCVLHSMWWRLLWIWMCKQL